MRAAAFIPDIHLPFHDPKALDVALSIISDLHKTGVLTEINILGDMLDFHALSLHEKMPWDWNEKVTVKEEIALGSKFLRQLRWAYPDCKITYYEGNHEYRLQRYIVKKCPELYDVFTLPELLGLEDKKIKFVPYKKDQLGKALDKMMYIRHVPYSQGENCAGASLKKKFRPLIFGHTHRRQSYTAKSADGDLLSCYSSGCLVDFNAAAFGYCDTENWAHNINIMYDLGEGDYNYLVHEIPILNGEAIYNGIHYKSEEGVKISESEIFQPFKTPIR